MAIVIRTSTGTNARNLINSGNFDSTSPWVFSSEDGDRLLSSNLNDWTNFSNLHLGEDTEVSGQNKSRYKYPIGKNGKIYATALRAVRIRSERNQDKTIFNEAGRLLNLLTSKQNDETKPKPNSNILQFARGQVRQLANTSDSTVGEMELFGIVGGSWFDDGETSITDENFIKTLRGFDSKVKSVNLLLNSPGGDVFQGRAIANMIRQSSLDFNINVIGEASSAASIIAMAGTSIHMSQGSLMLVHRCYSMFMANSIEAAKISRELNVIDQEAVSTYAEKTKMSRDEIISLMDENRYMTAQEAYDKGFCDSIDTEGKGAKTNVRQEGRYSILALSEEDRKKLHLPSLPESHRPNRLAAMNLISNMKKGFK